MSDIHLKRLNPSILTTLLVAFCCNIIATRAAWSSTAYPVVQETADPDVDSDSGSDSESDPEKIQSDEDLKLRGAKVDDKKKIKKKIPRPVEVYMGRRVAQTMHFAGAEWLIRDEREREERCSLMLANLGFKPGQTICDMGCGNGFYTLQIARMLGDRGTVIGVDVQPEMLTMMRERMEKEVVENIIPILGSYHDPRLPPNSVDLVLMVDVYHEFSHPEPMLAGIRKSLKADGRIVLVEYRTEDKSVPIKPDHKMTRVQMDKEMKANGFKLDSEFDRLPWQHMVFYRIDEDWKPKSGK